MADSILDLAKRHVDLRHAGGDEWAGLCPFHEERTPSFRVNVEKGVFHCFGCGAGGGAKDLAMRLGERLPTRIPAPRAIATSKVTETLVLHPSGDWMTWNEYLKVTYTPPWYRRELDKLVRECFSCPEEAHVAS